MSSDTIKKCFRKAGILTESFQVVQPSRISEESDPFLDIDESKEDDDACEVSDLVSTEDDVPVCAEFADDKWDKEFT